MHVGRCLKEAGEVTLVVTPLAPPTDSELQETRNMFDLAGVFPIRPQATTRMTERLARTFDSRCVNTHGERMEEADRDRIRELIAKHDLVWFHGVRTPNFMGDWEWPGSVLDIDDIPSGFHRTAMRRARGMIPRLNEARKAIQWKRREARLTERFGAIVTCSEEDRQMLGGGDRIHVIPNGYDVPATVTRRTDAGAPRIGFIGTLDYAPNRDGLEWLIREVWPTIRGERPDARLRIVGKGEPVAGMHGHEGIDHLGWVEDPADEIATWTSMAVPIHIGGGTRIKIAEAFARRCPVVSTTAGAYGYPIRHGEEILLADTASDFANACLSVIRDSSLGEGLVVRAAARFEREWSWDAIRPKVAAVVESQLRRRIAA